MLHGFLRNDLIQFACRCSTQMLRQKGEKAAVCNREKFFLFQQIPFRNKKGRGVVADGIVYILLDQILVYQIFDHILVAEIL